MNKGRRPSKGAFPACPVHGICKAESIRTHDACKNCAISTMSLKSYLMKLGSTQTLYERINKNCNECMDLLTRIISCITHSKEYDFENVVLFIYKYFGHGNVANRYIDCELKAPRPSDPAHARMILEELGLTCYHFNNTSLKCMYVEDLIFCKRHTPILSIHALQNMFKKYERSKRRKRKSASISISNIKKQILDHEKKLKKNKNNNYKKDIFLRQNFNTWLGKLSSTHC